MADRSMPQMFALGTGVVLLLLGVIGFFVNSDFSSGNAITADNLIVFDINGWSNLVHLMTGLLALYAASDGSVAKMYATAAGVFYVALTVWSLFDDSILGILPVNDPSAILYAAIGVVGLAVGLGPDRRSEPSQ
ncbi:MAG TPA: DUF4383 domain-containing protein [Solirubrobacterales bacterium]|nr:DUF4383 domain-containing protein [Solirubrobacterales bacterium]